MPATRQQRPEHDHNDDAVDGQPTPSPDEDGPHDVPDDEVIEKTLPSGRVHP